MHPTTPITARIMRNASLEEQLQTVEKSFGVLRAGTCPPRPAAGSHRSPRADHAPVRDGFSPRGSGGTEEGCRRSTKGWGGVQTWSPGPAGPRKRVSGSHPTDGLWGCRWPLEGELREYEASRCFGASDSNRCPKKRAPLPRSMTTSRCGLDALVRGKCSLFEAALASLLNFPL